MSGVHQGVYNSASYTVSVLALNTSQETIGLSEAEKMKIYVSGQVLVKETDENNISAELVIEVYSLNGYEIREKVLLSDIGDWTDLCGRILDSINSEVKKDKGQYKVVDGNTSKSLTNTIPDIITDLAYELCKVYVSSLDPIKILKTSMDGKLASKL